ncbi:MAG: glucuronyl hydrolase [Calditrichaeota bacterium]|nr:glucuronyl hydrolase [Calditrichota bacterium]
MIIFAAVLTCTKDSNDAFNAQTARARLETIAAKTMKMYEAVKDTNLLPRTVNLDGNLRLVPSSDWTSGFFPGILWYVYDYTKDKKFLQAAMRETALLEPEQFNTGSHDVGFMMFCSYGNGLKFTGDEKFKPILIQSAKSLITRFNPKVGCIKSWNNSRWEFPVIIDNMMNLELLFWAAKETGDSTFYQIAVSHANTTLKNHFRPDNSSFHVLSYDTLTGQVVARNTHQGLADSSAWARGQSWGLYGFTMAFRETKNLAYLEQATKIADFIIDHKNLPADKVPYWDYDASNSPNTHRDASAAAIMASALLELAQFLPENQGEKYFRFAEELLASLSSEKYFAAEGENQNFILKHCTGNKPRNSEVDVPLIYADYYYTEALIRYLKFYGEKN